MIRNKYQLKLEYPGTAAYYDHEVGVLALTLQKAMAHAKEKIFAFNDENELVHATKVYEVHR